MKLLREILISDLVAVPVWEHWIQDDIEYAKPSDKTEISETDEVGFIVLTEFEFSNGDVYHGFCSPKDTSGLDYIQPVVLIDDLHLEFWSEINLTSIQKTAMLKKLRLNFEEIFPVTFTSKIK